MMKQNHSLSDAAVVDRSKTVFINLEANQEASAVMAEFGYGADELLVGKALQAEAQKCLDNNKKETDESRSAYQAFAEKQAVVDKRYRMQRKKAKVVFRNNPLMMQKLGVDGTVPANYIDWLDKVRVYCMAVAGSEEIQEALKRLKVTIEEISETQADIQELDMLRATYIREKGESQQATQVKDKALSDLDKWMRDFFAVARIAFDDQPQMLEIFGVVVKS
ncbi:hypothetical protein J1N10_07250 [Carboxylicivirga sp. A043]|uniref:hypothetical protein n=1 Tax=Carboxylicivirga litoralis TaxID=2816963 RepID=UPI0021CB6E06|nr:hypothetical protein [Carboxylicivirga sp. A043]MCU4155769.1 hypothetical protein [Carboxylicivirga sp. A043]